MWKSLLPGRILPVRTAPFPDPGKPPFFYVHAGQVCRPEVARLFCLLTVLAVLVCGPDRALASETYVLDKNVLVVPGAAATVQNTAWVCGAGDYPNEMTRRLERLFAFTLEHLALNEYGSPTLRSARYARKQRKGEMTHVWRDDTDRIKAQRIYRNDRLGRDATAIARAIVALPDDDRKLASLFPRIVWRIYRDPRGMQWSCGEEVTLCPGTRDVSIEESGTKEIVFTECYGIGDLRSIADIQTTLAREFLNRYQAKVKRLKEMRAIGIRMRSGR